MSTEIVGMQPWAAQCFSGPSLPSVLNWYALYTCPRHEKWVAKQLADRQIESFAPLYRTVHQWRDRKKVVELALFPSYVFVRIDPAERLRVLQVPGVLHIVSFNGRPAPLPDADLEALRHGSDQQMNMEPCAYLNAGDRVRLVRGPLIGATAILMHFKGRLRVVVTLEALMRSVAVEVGAHDVVPLR